jgi:hypothetical protein
MTLPHQHQIETTITCPVCDGTGTIKEAYLYRQRHKYDSGREAIEHAETCWLCGGENNGRITHQQYEEWLKFEGNPTCPLCNGTGGKRHWSWHDGEHGSRKEFSFAPCRVCEGKRRVSPERVYKYEREKQQLRFWGVGCTALLIVIGIVGGTQILTVLLKGTPWFQCCPAPGLIPLGVILMGIRGYSTQRREGTKAQRGDWEIDE